MPRGKAGSDLAKPEARYQWLDLPRLPLLRILEIVHAGSSLQNPACVCRAWHTAAHEIRLGDTASSRPVRRLAISQGSGQQAQTLQTCAGICVAEGASSGFEACSQPRWRHDQGATSAGKEQHAAAANVGSLAQPSGVVEAGQAAAAAQPATNASAGPSSRIAARAGPPDVGSPITAIGSRKRRRVHDRSGDTGGPQPQLRRPRMATRAMARAGKAAEPSAHLLPEQSRRRAPVAAAARGLASSGPKPGLQHMRVRSAARKLQAARAAAELVGLSEQPHVSDEASPSVEASEDGTSDASGAQSLAEGAANGNGAVAEDRPQSLCHWLLSLVGRR